MFEWKIDGVKMPAPDMDDFGADNEDLDGEASGRGETGVMKRVVIRKNVETIPMKFTLLTTAEKNMIVSAIAPPSITIYIDDGDGEPRTFSGYVSKYSKRCKGWCNDGPVWSLEFNLVQN